MLSNLINEYGKERLNSLTKYPSIPTFHVLGEKGRLTDALTHDFGVDYTCTEKADGTNVRIITYRKDVIIGSREELCYLSGDVFYNPSLGIVEAILPLLPRFVNILPYMFCVFYGELYGGRIGSNWKQYGETPQFKLFDAWGVNIIKLESLIAKPISGISTWRESERGGCNQPFLKRQDLVTLAEELQIDVVSPVEFTLQDTSHQGILDELKRVLPNTKYGEGTGRSEGLVIRNADRSKIAKIRFEDYQRSLPSATRINR